MFYTGDFYQDSNGRIFCVAGIDIDKALVSLADTTAFIENGKGKKPKVFEFHKLARDVDAKRFIPINYCYIYRDLTSLNRAMESSSLELSDKPMRQSEGHRINKKLQLIADFIENPELLHDYLFNGLSLNNYAKKYNLPSHKVYAVLHQYLALGSQPNAFIDRYDVPVISKKDDGKVRNKSGPPISQAAVHSGREAHAGIGPIHLQIIREVCTPLLKHSNLYIQYCYDKYLAHLIEKHALVRYDELGITRFSHLSNSLCISERAFGYHFGKIFPQVELVKVRRGSSDYKNNVEARPGNASDAVLYAGQLYEVDSTPLDFYVYVDEKYENFAVVKPTLYIIVDVLSRLVVSVNISMSAENTAAIQDLFYYAFTDKVQFCAEKGVCIDADQWPKAPVPTQTMRDNSGPFRADNTSRFFSQLPVTFDGFARSHSGPDKPHVERRIELVHKILTDKVGQRIRKKEPIESVKPQHRAQISFEQLMQLTIESVLQLNNETYLESHSDREAALKGIRLTALEAFKRSTGMMSQLARPRYLSEEELRLKLLPTATALMSNESINFKGVRYTSADPVVLAMMTDCSPQINGPKIDEVQYSSHSVNLIWLRRLDKSTGLQLYPLTLSTKDRRFSNLSEWEVDVVRKVSAEQDKTYTQLEAESRAQGHVRASLLINKSKGVKAPHGKNTVASNTAVKRVEQEAGFGRAHETAKQYTENQKERSPIRSFYDED